MPPVGEQSIMYEVRDRVAWITVNRPDKLNALNRSTVEKLRDAALEAADDPAVRVLVVTGAGEKAFVAGADIEEMAALSADEAHAYSRFLNESFRVLEACVKPVVAAVNGFALGGGCELAMACHVRIASSSARFGQPEVGLGLIPGAGGTQRLARLVGRGKALDLILTGDMIDATEALRVGLVDRVAPPEELRTTVDDWTARVVSRSARALARSLEAVVGGEALPSAEALRLESSLFGLAFATDDMREGTRAFLEKRKPKFTGR